MPLGGHPRPINWQVPLLVSFFIAYNFAAISDLANRALNYDAKESRQLAMALVCSDEKEPDEKLVFVAPTGPQQYASKKTPCREASIPDPAMG